jgi:hypothetical protein
MTIRAASSRNSGVYVLFFLPLDPVLSAENPTRIRSPEHQWHPKCGSAARRRLVDAIPHTGV